jgi:hypothetical protein
MEAVMALDNAAKNGGVWKSGKGKGRAQPKGRQVEDNALATVRALLAGRALDRDLLIEHLHVIQDRFGHLSAAHLRALADLGHRALGTQPRGRGNTLLVGAGDYGRALLRACVRARGP